MTVLSVEAGAECWVMAWSGQGCYVLVRMKDGCGMEEGPDMVVAVVVTCNSLCDTLFCFCECYFFLFPGFPY